MIKLSRDIPRYHGERYLVRLCDESRYLYEMIYKDPDQFFTASGIGGQYEQSLWYPWTDFSIKVLEALQSGKVENSPLYLGRFLVVTDNDVCQMTYNADQRYFVRGNVKVAPSATKHYTSWDDLEKAITGK